MVDMRIAGKGYDEEKHMIDVIKYFLFLYTCVVLQ